MVICYRGSKNLTQGSSPRACYMLCVVFLGEISLMQGREVVSKINLKEGLLEINVCCKAMANTQTKREKKKRESTIKVDKSEPINFSDKISRI